MTDKLSPLVHFNPRAWNAFLKEIKDGRFDHTLAKGLLDKINSPSYWVDAAKTTGFANEETFELFKKWLNLIEQGFIESPIKEKSRPEKIAELSAASSSEYFKESRDLFESIIESGRKFRRKRLFGVLS